MTESDKLDRFIVLSRKILLLDDATARCVNRLNYDMAEVWRGKAKILREERAEVCR